MSCLPLRDSTCTRASGGSVPCPSEGADTYMIMLTFASFLCFVWSVFWKCVKLVASWRGKWSRIPCFLLDSLISKGKTAIPPRIKCKYEGHSNVFFLLMPVIFWPIPLFFPQICFIIWRSYYSHLRMHVEDVDTFQGSERFCVCHDLIICAFFSFWHRDRWHKSKEDLSKQWCRAAPILPSLYFFQLQRTVILFWALRAKHLLRFVCQSFSSPRGRYGSQERNRCRNVVERPAAGACFHYLKPPESREQKEMWMEKTYLSSGCEVQPAFWMIFFFFPSFFFLLHISSEAEAYCADCFHLGLFYKQKYLLQL